MSTVSEREMRKEELKKWGKKGLNWSKIIIFSLISHFSSRQSNLSSALKKFKKLARCSVSKAS